MKGSFHENSVSLREQDKAEFLLPSCINFKIAKFTKYAPISYVI